MVPSPSSESICESLEVILEVSLFYFCRSFIWVEIIFKFPVSSHSLFGTCITNLKHVLTETVCHIWRDLTAISISYNDGIYTLSKGCSHIVCTPQKTSQFSKCFIHIHPDGWKLQYVKSTRRVYTELCNGTSLPGPYCTLSCLFSASFGVPRP